MKKELFPVLFIIYNIVLISSYVGPEKQNQYSSMEKAMPVFSPTKPKHLAHGQAQTLQQRSLVVLRLSKLNRTRRTDSAPLEESP
jgi:hypothetical protein